VGSLSDDVRDLIEGLDKGRQAWVNGRLEWTGTSAFHQADDMTIFGPFGGEAALGDPDRQAAVAANFRNGTGHCQVIKVIEEGDIVVVVMIEWNSVTFSGESKAQPWILRTTQVFRRDGPGHWLRLHRHADPLIKRLSLSDTLDLLKDQVGDV